MKVNKATLKFTSQIAIIILFFLALTELALAIWTVADDRYKSLAYSLSDVGYIVSEEKNLFDISVSRTFSSFIGSMDIEIFVLVLICQLHHNLSDVFNSYLGSLFSTSFPVHCHNHVNVYLHW